MLHFARRPSAYSLNPHFCVFYRPALSFPALKLVTFSNQWFLYLLRMSVAFPLISIPFLDLWRISCLQFCRFWFFEFGPSSYVVMSAKDRRSVSDWSQDYQLRQKEASVLILRQWRTVNGDDIDNFRAFFVKNASLWRFGSCLGQWDSSFRYVLVVSRHLATRRNGRGSWQTSFHENARRKA